MVYVLLGHGFEEMEAISPVDCLRRAGVAVTTLGIGGREITGGHGMTLLADEVLETADTSDLEMVILPGGLGGVHAILGSEAAEALIRKAYAEGNYVCAICAAPNILGGYGMLEGRTAVCYPGMEDGMPGSILSETPVAVDGKIITAEAAGSAIPFGLKLVEVLKGRQAAEAVANEIYYHGEF